VVGLELDFAADEQRRNGLHRYLGLVADALGLTGRSYTVDHHSPMNAYIAVSTRAAHLQDCDMALLWDERIGWWVVTEPTEGDLVAVAALGGDILPTPEVVAAFLESVVADVPMTPMRDGSDTTGDLHHRLRRFATPARNAAPG